MITLFTACELAHMAFEPVARRPLPPEYLAERERVWQAELELCRARGDQMWNGQIYTIEDVRQGGSLKNE